jgi:hypothetical protein
MQSKITIEIDFENGNEPVIQIIYRQSDDIRDKLIRAFIERLGGNSWCKIYCQQTIGHDEPEERRFQRWKISPIGYSQLKEDGEAMLEQYRLERLRYTGDTSSNPAMPRRIQMALWCPAEHAIHNAMQEVEKMDADTRLTEAVTLLSRAKDLVADFIDKK